MQQFQLIISKFFVYDREMYQAENENDEEHHKNDGTNKKEEWHFCAIQNLEWQFCYSICTLPCDDDDGNFLALQQYDGAMATAGANEPPKSGSERM